MTILLYLVLVIIFAMFQTLLSLEAGAFYIALGIISAIYSFDILKSKKKKTTSIDFNSIIFGPYYRYIHFALFFTASFYFSLFLKDEASLSLDEGQGESIITAMIPISLLGIFLYRQKKNTYRQVKIENKLNSLGSNTIDDLNLLKQQRKQLIKLNVTLTFAIPVILIIILIIGLFSTFGSNFNLAIWLISPFCVLLFFIMKNRYDRKLLNCAITVLEKQKTTQESEFEEREDILFDDIDFTKIDDYRKKALTTYLAILSAISVVFYLMVMGSESIIWHYLLFMISFIICRRIYKAQISKYADYVKSLAVDTLLEPYGLSYNQNSTLDKNLIRDILFVDVANVSLETDTFEGDLNGRHIRFQEFESKKHTNFFLKIFGRDSSGVICEINLKQEISSHTIMLSKSLRFGSFWEEKYLHSKSGMDSVSFPVSKFMDQYAVYSNDQIESRVFLEPAFIEKFLNTFEQFSSDGVLIGLKQQHLIFVLSSDKDHFEFNNLGLFSPLKNKDFEPIVRHIETFRDIIHLLDTESRKEL